MKYFKLGLLFCYVAVITLPFIELFLSEQDEQENIDHYIVLPELVIAPSLR